jgi:threonine/homoserine/homoserine lactone efflux protein
MPQPEVLLTFALAVVVLAVTPGPDIMLIMARGIGQGRKVALMTVVGIVFIAGIVQLPCWCWGSPPSSKLTPPL